LPIDFTPLRKVLELEHKKDYSDSAVIGGLDRFLAKWVTQAEGSITEPKLLNRFYKLNAVAPIKGMGAYPKAFGGRVRLISMEETDIDDVDLDELLA